MLNELKIWVEGSKELQEILGIYCKNFSDVETYVFKEIGKSLGLNPMFGEMYGLKFKNKTGGLGPAQIFIGKNGYLKGADRQKEYQGHFVDIVREGDHFEKDHTNVENPIKHTYGEKRGKIIMAYFLGWRSDRPRPVYHFAAFDEYYKPNSDSWQKKETMICKVALSQGLRILFPSAFSGTYDESERWDDEPKILNPEPLNQTFNSEKKNVLTMKKPLKVEEPAEDAVFEESVISDAPNISDVVEVYDEDFHKSAEIDEKFDNYCYLMEKCTDLDSLKSIFGPAYKEGLNISDILKREVVKEKLLAKYNPIKEQLTKEQLTPKSA